MISWREIDKVILKYTAFKVEKKVKTHGKFHIICNILYSIFLISRCLQVWKVWFTVQHFTFLSITIWSPFFSDHQKYSFWRRFLWSNYGGWRNQMFSRATCDWSIGFTSLYTGLYIHIFPRKPIICFMVLVESISLTGKRYDKVGFRKWPFSTYCANGANDIVCRNECGSNHFSSGSYLFELFPVQKRYSICRLSIYTIIYRTYCKTYIIISHWMNMILASEWYEI